MATLSGDVQLAYTNFAVKLQVGQITAKLTYSFSKGGFRIQAIFHSKLRFLAVRPNTTALDIVQICGEISLRQEQIQLKHSQIHHSALVLQAVMLCSSLRSLLVYEEGKKVFYISSFLAPTVLALVEWTCDKQMSLWLLLNGLLSFLVWFVLCQFAILAISFSILSQAFSKDRTSSFCLFSPLKHSLHVSAVRPGHMVSD